MQEKSKVTETLKLKGHINIKLYDSEGVLKQEIDKDNLVVSVGKAYLATWLAAASQAGEFMSYIGLGTGMTAPTIGDTNLQTPLPTRVQGLLTTPGSTNIWQNQATFGPGVDTGAITEAGLFSASTLGTMFARQVFAVVNKGAGDTFVLTWQVSFN
jgi:hypothetical protein